jgi:RNA polymerase sigma-70 factor (ECF subfamily)
VSQPARERAFRQAWPLAIVRHPGVGHPGAGTDWERSEVSLSKRPSSLEARYAEFTEQLSACQSQLLATTYALVQNMADAEDICQRAALVLWSKFDEFEPGTSFRSWALTVTRYQAMNFVRKRQNERLFFSEKVLLALADTQDELAEESAQQELRWSHLSACIGKLPAQQQRLVQLYYEGTRTLATVAEMLSASEGSVRTALCRIRQALRKCVQQSIRENPA